MFRPGYFYIIIVGFLAVMFTPISSRTLFIENDLLSIRSYASDFEIPPEYSYPFGTSGVYPEWLGDEPETPVAYDSAKLDSIDYSLKVIAGGIILAIDGLFVWFMILKPLKQFIVF